MSGMSNENQETIADIVRGMRRLGRLDEKSTDKIPRSLQALGLRTYADRIEAAANHQFRDTTKMIPEEVAVSKMETTTPTCEKSSQVGNAAAMREALKETQSVIEKCSNILRYIPDGCEYDEILDEVADNLYELQKTHVKSALSAPPRNCDIMDWRTAWAKWRTECHPQKPCGYAEVVSGTEQFMDWYMSEAKGGAK